MQKTKNGWLIQQKKDRIERFKGDITKKNNTIKSTKRKIRTFEADILKQHKNIKDADKKLEALNKTNYAPEMIKLCMSAFPMAALLGLLKVFGIDTNIYVDGILLMLLLGCLILYRVNLSSTNEEVLTYTNIKLDSSFSIKELELKKKHLEEDIQDIEEDIKDIEDKINSLEKEITELSA